jgi:hypothetical protein
VKLTSQTPSSTSSNAHRLASRRLAESGAARPSNRYTRL